MRIIAKRLGLVVLETKKRIHKKLLFRESGGLSILHMPTEILLEIAEHLEGKDLLNFSAVSQSRIFSIADYLHNPLDMQENIQPLPSIYSVLETRHCPGDLTPCGLYPRIRAPGAPSSDPKGRK